jgi:phosphotransferase system HPr-like phosphotransfer protein
LTEGSLVEVLIVGKRITNFKEGNVLKKEYYLIIPKSFTVCQAFDVVKIANMFKSSVRFYKDELSADGKDITSVMLLFLTLKKNDLLSLEIDGLDRELLSDEITAYMMDSSKVESELDCWQQEALYQLTEEVKAMKTVSLSDLRCIAKSYLKITKEMWYGQHKEEPIVFQ